MYRNRYSFLLNISLLLAAIFSTVPATATAQEFSTAGFFEIKDS